LERFLLSDYLEAYRSCDECLTPLLHSIHSLGMVGHIEDIAVAKDQQGKKLGLRIIQALDYVAEQVGCYKVCARYEQLDTCCFIPHSQCTLGYS
jgi:GNAT superfamily N-acetyltransferase